MLRREFSLLTTVMEAISVSSSTNLLLLLLSLLPLLLLLLLLLLLTTVIADISLLSRPVLDLPNPIRSKNKILYDVSITSLVVEFIPKKYFVSFRLTSFSNELSFTSCTFLHRHLLPIDHSLNVIFRRVPLLDLSQQPRPRLRPAGSPAATGVESRPLVQLLLLLQLEAFSWSFVDILQSPGKLESWLGLITYGPSKSLDVGFTDKMKEESKILSSFSFQFSFLCVFFLI